MRFGLEVFSAIRKRVGDDFLVAIVVDIGNIIAHSVQGGVANLLLQFVGKCSITVVDVKPVRYAVIIGNVNIRPAIVVNIRYAAR